MDKKFDKKFFFFDDIFVMKSVDSHKFISFKKKWIIGDDVWFKLEQSKALIRAISNPLFIVLKYIP
ncbi:hypothetical protein [Leptospira borgpetersenii]|uniref:hypothetical protein n=1 Tax=Leptospira borgpetersenii TaxID=174 RepID=UPI000519D7E9|nr:hypothetical protein [Leptospira borgpetersenii]